MSREVGETARRQDGKTARRQDGKTARKNVRQQPAATLEIVPAAPGDLRVIQSMLEEAQRWLASRGIAQWRRPFGEEWIGERIANGEFYVGSVDGNPVAVVRLLESDPVFWGEREWGDALYVHSLAVARPRAGSGIGAAMLEWAARRAVGDGRRFLRLDCAAANDGLVAYYRRLGFAKVDEVRVGGETLALLEKDLSTSR